MSTNTSIVAVEALCQDAKNERNRYALRCLRCHEDFTAKSPLAKYCSDKCRAQQHRESPAHKRYLEKQVLRRRERHMRYTTERLARCAVHPSLGHYSGEIIKGQPLKSFPLPNITEVK